MIKSRRLRWAGHVARMAKRNACRILVGKPEGERLLGRQRHMWMDNIKMDLREIGWVVVGRIDLAQDRDHGNKPSGSIKCWEILE
jgi:proteasome lid subunit RPN8/RPN11